MPEVKMLPAEREERILSFLLHRGWASIPDISRELQISEATVRRDLGHLSEYYPIRRVYGGAVLQGNGPLEPPILQRRGLQVAEKQRIGKAAAALVCDGDTVILMGGSTTLEIVGHLAGKQDVTIITDSILIAQKAARQPRNAFILLGGSVRAAELTMQGPLAQLCLRELHAHKMFMGARAVTLDQGIMLNETSEVALFREASRMASEVILPVDHTKFGQTATAVLGPLSMVHHVVTDSGIAPDIPTRLLELGIRVTIA